MTNGKKNCYFAFALRFFLSFRNPEIIDSFRMCRAIQASKFKKKKTIYENSTEAVTIQNQMFHKSLRS